MRCFCGSRQPLGRFPPNFTGILGMRIVVYERDLEVVLLCVRENLVVSGIREYVCEKRHPPPHPKLLPPPPPVI